MTLQTWKRSHKKIDEQLHREMCSKVQLGIFYLHKQNVANSSTFYKCRNHIPSQIEYTSVSTVIKKILMLNFGRGLTTL